MENLVIDCKNKCTLERAPDGRYSIYEYGNGKRVWLRLFAFGTSEDEAKGFFEACVNMMEEFND